jgi:V8-like Glu-specific endopeptidase
MADDADAAISNDDDIRELVEPRASGDVFALGEHAELGLETVAGWAPPRAYAHESTAARTREATSIRGVDALLPERRSPVERPHYVRESTIDADERVRIHATEAFPWRAICQLRIYSRLGGEFIGTGWMIGPRTVVTAGHCVYLPEIGGWADRIAVSPARNGNDRPFSSIMASKFHSVRGWTIDGLREHDYAVIQLPEDQAVPEIGTLGYATCETPKLVGGYVNIAGYPADKDDGTTLWWSARRSLAVDEQVITYDADTAAGQSGAPVWRLDPASGRRVVIGIHTNGARTGNSAVRINPKVLKNLRAWTL